MACIHELEAWVVAIMVMAMVKARVVMATMARVAVAVGVHE